MLQDYVDKESRLLDLKTEKLELARGDRSSLKRQISGLSDDMGDMEEKQVKQPLGDISAIEMHEGILVKQV